MFSAAVKQNLDNKGAVFFRGQEFYMGFLPVLLFYKGFGIFNLLFYNFTGVWTLIACTGIKYFLYNFVLFHIEPEQLYDSQKSRKIAS